MIELVIVAVVSFLAGAAFLGTSNGTPVIERYRDVEGRHYERWQAYCRLLGAEPVIRVQERTDGKW